MESILTSIKKLLGPEEAETFFDPDIIMHINTVFMYLHQLGVGPKTGFRIKDKQETWEMFIGDTILQEAVKSYIYLQVKLLFDPPSTSFAIEAIERQIVQIGWRLNIQAEAAVVL